MTQVNKTYPKNIDTITPYNQILKRKNFYRNSIKPYYQYTRYILLSFTQEG